MTSRRSLLIYGILLAFWVLLVGWQVAEHLRVRESARVALVNRAKDISSTLSLVVRSQRRFGGFASKERLESALKELIKHGGLNGVALLNASGETVVSVGSPPGLESRGVVTSGAHWREHHVTIVNLVDLGTNVMSTLGGTNPTIVVSRPRPSETNGPPVDPSHPPVRGPAALSPTNAPGGAAPPPPRYGGFNARDGRPPFGRPPWMNEEEFKEMIKKQGVHGFVLKMSTDPLRQAANQDLWLRTIIILLATVSVVGSGFAWRAAGKSSDLQIRLVRASELTAHLKEMNLAAAGLAHETRNPLNIIRGLAQMVSQKQDASPEIRQKTREIIDEADRVTAQMNEFINYSRPREVRRLPVALGSVVGDVVRALSHDLEEKKIQLAAGDAPFTVEADEQLLRQALFNLMMNSIQAVEPGGQIKIQVEKNGTAELAIEIRDNGPGVPPEHRTDIFKPYYTTHAEGTGLGLAIVQQIVLAHGWDIQCLANDPCGANFRINHLKLTTTS